jgi:crotonobetainyl-CoA:carnitine CoA-transferase CaiB-like acyl-CoA transferase
MPPLEGILVADFSRVLAGPLAAMLLGDLGADVIKVERPDGGDDTRAWGPPWHEGESTYYLGLNRNKRSIALDLAVESDLALARSLAARADVLIESFRPGLISAWGLDGDSVRAAGNPGLVSCSVTAFGTTSDAATALPGYDFLLQAMGGLMAVTGEPDGRPLKAGTAVVDLVCGLLAANGIQAALLERTRTGVGRHVEVSLMDSALTALLNQGSAWVTAGVRGQRRGNRHPSIVPYETYETADRPLAIAVGNDRMFARLCAVVGLPEIASDERFATNTSRIDHADEFAVALESVLRREPAAHWLALLREAKVPAGPINEIDEAFALADDLGMEPTSEVDGVPLIRPPLRFDGERPPIRHRPPRLDEHGEAIRAFLNGDSPRLPPV